MSEKKHETAADYYKRVTGGDEYHGYTGAPAPKPEKRDEKKPEKGKAK